MMQEDNEEGRVSVLVTVPSDYIIFVINIIILCRKNSQESVSQYN